MLTLERPAKNGVLFNRNGIFPEAAGKSPLTPLTEQKIRRITDPEEITREEWNMIMMLRDNWRRKIAMQLIACLLVGNLIGPQGLPGAVEVRAAEPAGPFSYVGADGKSQSHSAIVLEGNEPVTGAGVVELAAGWYVVNSEINYDKPVVMKDSGEYHIILADGGKLNIKNIRNDFDNTYLNEGLTRGENEDNYPSLTIYGQSGGTGEMNVETDGFLGHALDAGSITINGGKVTATTNGSGGTCIYAADSITINGGKVTATANESGGNGIRADGGFFDETQGIITVNGGEVIAKALNNGDYGQYGMIANKKVIVNGGQVTAEGTTAGMITQQTVDSDISLSWKKETDFIKVNSFKFNNAGEATTAIVTGKTFVNETDEKYYITENASELKSLTDVELRPSTTSAYYVKFESNGGTPVPAQVVPQGGKVKKPDDPANGDYKFGGWYQDDSTFNNLYNFNTPVTSKMTLYAKWVTKSYDLNDASIKQIYRYTRSTVEPVVRDNMGTGLSKGTDYEISFTKDGSTVDEMKDPGFYNITVKGKGSYTGSQTAKALVLTFSEYYPETGELNDMATLPDDDVNVNFVTASTVLMDSGWYVVGKDVTVSHRMEVKGDVKLVLCDGATLDAGATGDEGIRVPDGNTLTIYSQKGNTGKLIAKTNQAKSPSLNAAIGADQDKDDKAGTIVIHGGEIIAEAVFGSAGLGMARYKDAGKIMIYGGKITARKYGSGDKGTDIGGPSAEIYLSHCRSDDYIVSDSYQGNVTIDRPFILDGTSTLADPSNIAGKKLIPVNSDKFFTITFNSNGGNGVASETVVDGAKASEPDTPIKQGYSFQGWYKAGSESPYDFSKPVGEDLTLTARWAQVPPISYIDSDGQEVSNFTEYSPMEDSYTVMQGGTYYVGRDTVLSRRVSAEGSVNLILGDGCKLTADKGIGVMKPNALSIFCQKDGTGTLEAKSEDNYAAIGGDWVKDVVINEDSASGIIRIYGGSVKATGGLNAAAIGGGYNNITTGDIHIHGGRIDALSGRNAAAVGDGQSLQNSDIKSKGFIEITGGELTLKADDNSVGIGGDKSYRDRTIRILGGKIKISVSRNQSFGIGVGSDGNITLGCSNENDYISSPSYMGGSIMIPSDQILITEPGRKTLRNRVTDLNDINGQKLMLKHKHRFKYSCSDDGGVITATCDAEGCDLSGTGVTLSLAAPDGSLDYDGEPKAAVINDPYGISGSTVLLYREKNGNTWGDAVTTAPKDAGTYKALITLKDMGHGPATAAIEYTIEPKDVTITGLGADDKVYDGTAAAVITGKPVINGLIEGDDVAVSQGRAEFDNADAGESKTVSFTGFALDGKDVGNYHLFSQPDRVTKKIRKRSLTIKAKDQIIPINEHIQTGVNWIETMSGSLVEGQEIVGVTLTTNPTDFGQVTENGTITPENAVIKNGNADVTKNYKLSYEDGNLTITYPGASVRTAPIGRTDLKYAGHEVWQELIIPGTAETSMEYAVQRVSYGDGTPLEGVDGSVAPTDGYWGDSYKAWEAGEYHVWYRAAADDTHAAGVPEYVSVTIDRALMTITLGNAKITYGEDPKASDISVSYKSPVVASGDTGFITVIIREPDYKPGYDVGSYYVYATFKSNDYAITYTPGILTVEPKEIGLDWGDTDFDFDGTPKAPTAAATGVLDNDAVSVTVSGARINAGEGIATAALLTGEKAGNYKLPDANTRVFTIKKASAPGGITDVTKEISKDSSSLQVSLAGKMPLNAGNLSFNKVGGAVKTTGSVTVNDWNVDSVTGLVTANISGGAAGDTITLPVKITSENYEDTTVNVKVTIVDKTDAKITIKGGSSLNYDYGSDAFTVQAECRNPVTDGVWNWESSNTEVAETQGNGSECTVTIKGAGTTSITVKYDSEGVTGSAVLTLTVKPGSVEIPKAAERLFYDGSEQTGVAPGKWYTIKGGKGVNPGSYIAEAALKDTVNMRWEDGTAEVKYISWSIGKAKGPDAPRGLKAIPPTTGDNIDGKITGVTTDMEYSQDLSFSGAIPCAGTEIVNLKPGTYYVRVRESATNEAGEAASVVVPERTRPIVSAKQSLRYNGTDQVLVDVGSVTEGTLYFAVTVLGDKEPDNSRYSTDIPSRKDAGSYLVWYMIRKPGGTETAPANIRVDISKINYNINRTGIVTNAGIGTEGIIELEPHIPEDDYELLLTKVDNWNRILVDGSVSFSGSKVNYTMSDDRSRVGEKAWISVSVNKLRNYHPFQIFVSLNAIICDHHNKEPRYIADGRGWLICRDCNAVLSKDCTVLAARTGLIYNGKAQELITPGMADAELEYALGENADIPPVSGYSSAIPKAVDARTQYYVWYRVKKDGIHLTGDVGCITVSIGKAPLSVTAKPKNIIYGDGPANDGVLYSGFVNGETESTDGVLSGTLTFSYDYERYGNAGNNYSITPSGLTSDNYEISYIPGKLSVKPKEVGLSWSTADLTYNGSAQAPSAKATGLLNGDLVSVSVTGAATDAGDDYTATASGLTGEKAGNYMLPSDRTMNFAIKKADVVFKAPKKKESLVYTGSAQPLVEAGSAVGGKLMYALGTDAVTAPAADKYSESIPTGTEVGTYYVWYKVAGDENHNDTESEVLPVEILPVTRDSLISLVNDARERTEISNLKRDEMVNLLNTGGTDEVKGIFQNGYDTVSTDYVITNGKFTRMSINTGSLKEGKNYLTVNSGVRLLLGETFTITGNYMDAKDAKKVAKFVKTGKEGCVFEPGRLKSHKGGSYQVTLTSGKKELIVDVIDISLNKKALKAATLTDAVTLDAVSANAVAAAKIGPEGSSVNDGVVTIATTPVLKTEIEPMKDMSARFISGIWKAGDTYVSRGEIKTVKKGKVSVIVKANTDGTLSIGKAEGSGKGSLIITYTLNGKVKKTKNGTKIKTMVYKAKIKVK